MSGGAGNVLMPYSQDNCIDIPQTATYEIQDKTYVFLVKDGLAKSRIIDIFPLSNGKEYVVQGGLATGDTIVAAGVGLLRDGAPVSIKNVIKAAEQ